MFSSGGTESAPFAANCIMFEGSLEARIRSIVRDIASPPGPTGKSPAGRGLARMRSSATSPLRSSFELPNGELKFANQPVRFASKKFLQQRPIVPKSSVAPAREALPHPLPDFPVVASNGAHIIELVRRGDQPGFCIGILQVPDISFLAFAPRRLWFRIGVRAPLHNLSHAASKLAPDLPQHRRTPAVFHNIVQQRSDCHVFVAAKLQHQRGDPHQVRDVRNRRRLARLSGMLLGGKVKGAQKPRTELHRFLFHPRCLCRSRAHYCFSPRRADKYARMNGCKSPSSTRSTSPTSVFVR